MRKKIGPIVAWAGSIAILIHVFRKIPLGKVWEAMHLMAWWAIPAIAIIVLAVYLADSFAIQKTFGWFVAPLSYREVLIVRGATYLLALVNYAVGQGAIIYFVNRTRKVPILRGTAAVLLVMGINVLMLLVLATVGLLVSSEVSAWLRTLLLAAYGGLAIYIVLVALRPRWLAKRPIFDVLLAAGLFGHLRCMLVRVPHICALLVLSWVSMAAFGVIIPVDKAVLQLPIVYFVTVLPIFVQGLGPNQELMKTFFAEYARGATPLDREAAVVAASLLLQVVANVIQLGAGLLCMRTPLARALWQSNRAATASDGSPPQEPR